jgi:hypothetical protein
MPLMQDSVSVAANAVSANVLAGQLYEFVNPGTLVTVSVTGSATGLRATFICGTPIINDQAINLQNRFPLIPDDLLTTGPVPGGRMVLTARNTTAGALTFFWRVDL